MNSRRVCRCGAGRYFLPWCFTLLNLQGIKTSARVNAGLAAGMSAVVVVVFVTTIRYIFGHPHSDPGFFTRPFYDPQTFTFDNLSGCTSIAVLTYIGFDGISTLSEEAENPRRNIMLATVMTCLAVGILSAAEVYVAQLVWPASQPFPNQDQAYVFAAARAWAPMFTIVGATLLVANFGSGMGAQIGAARLLYGMGKSNALPKSFFGQIDPKHGIPRNNVLFIGAIVLIGSFFLTFGARHRVAELRRAARVHGSQCVLVRALFLEGRGKDGVEFYRAGCRLFRLRALVVDLEYTGEISRNGMDGCGNRIWNLEDRLVPQTAVV